MFYMGRRKAKEVYLGAKKVQKIYLGEVSLFVAQMAVESTLDGVTSDAPTEVAFGEELVVTLEAETGIQIASVTVTMGNVDITSAAYDETTNTISIASVTDNVGITAIGVIIFEDAAVKAICVENWGDGTIADEMTKAEAAAVTSLAGKFRNNTDITKFNELQYFTSLTSLYVTGTGDSVSGEFGGCSNLTEIIIPAAPINDFRGAFRFTGIVNLDISPTTASSFRMDAMVQGGASGTTALRTVKLPGSACTYMIRGFRRARGLTTITIDGTLDLSSVSEYTSCFESDTALTTITGALTGIRANMNIQYCPLTVESALVILNGLDDVSGKKITFKASQQAIFEANADFQTALARVVGYGWTIAYA